jgi:hypothetical protein
MLTLAKFAVLVGLAARWLLKGEDGHLVIVGCGQDITVHSHFMKGAARDP